MKQLISRLRDERGLSDVAIILLIALAVIVVLLLTGNIVLDGR